MSLLEIYRGDSKRINLAFTNDDGSPLNLSGYAVYYTAKKSYAETGAPIVDILVTGHDVPVSGLTHITLTSTDTNRCPGEYVAGFTLVDPNSGVSTFNTDGLSIFPSPRIIT